MTGVISASPLHGKHSTRELCLLQLLFISLSRANTATSLAAVVVVVVTVVGLTIPDINLDASTATKKDLTVTTGVHVSSSHSSVFHARGER